MESILNQFFWLWAPLSLMPEWLRIGIVIFLIILFTRPLLMSLIPFLINIILKAVKKIHYWVSYPGMKLIESAQKKRRAAGKDTIPFWVDAYEGVGAIVEGAIDKALHFFRKRPAASSKKTKKWTRNIAFVAAVLMSLAITNNPEEWYSAKWNEADTWLTVEKLENTLNFRSEEFLASAKSKVKETTTDSKVHYVLTDEYKTGGTIRETPSLSGTPLAEIYGDETLLYLGEQTDADGITWLKVRTQSGVEGWISSNIVWEI